MGEADLPLKIETHGVKALASALRQMEVGAQKELAVGFRAIAENVAASARAKVPGTGKAAASIRARGSTRGGSIAFGGTAAPHYPWLDFGGTTGRGHKLGKNRGSIRREWLGNPVGEGRYIYPTIREKRSEIIRDVDKMTERLARKAGFDTNG